jgi:SAM-dependent methyltransferase
MAKQDVTPPLALGSATVGAAGTEAFALRTNEGMAADEVASAQSRGPNGGYALALAEAYDQYIRSGFYDSRYPQPNAAMVKRLRATLPEAGQVLDFGCGTGRYIPIMLERPKLVTIGYDISSEAISSCKRRFAPELAAGRLRMVLGTLNDLTEVVEPGSLDLALLLFGVLGHIRGRAQRIRTLGVLRGLLRPEGRLMVTVPNRRRRFGKEQVAAAPLVRVGQLEPGDVLYRRTSGTAAVDLYYHLYSPSELLDELAEAGFTGATTFVESVLPERASISGPIGELADDVLRLACPLSLAYGFGAVARRNGIG